MVMSLFVTPTLRVMRVAGHTVVIVVICMVHIPIVHVVGNMEQVNVSLQQYVLVHRPLGR